MLQDDLRAREKSAIYDRDCAFRSSTRERMAYAPSKIILSQTRRTGSFRRKHFAFEAEITKTIFPQRKRFPNNNDGK